MTGNLRRTFVSLLVLPLLAAAAPPGKRGITEKDILKFRWVADPQIAPDGGQVAYVLVTVDEKEDRYATSLWAVSTSGGSPPRRLTAGPGDLAPRWSPDGKTLAFLRAEEKDPPQIHLLPMMGGEARRLTDLPKGAGAPVWTPSGNAIAFTSTTSTEDFAEREAKKQGRDIPKKSDVHVVTRAVYRFNGQDWFEPGRHAHVWTAPVAPSDGPVEATQITSGKFDEGAPQWSPDGSLARADRARGDLVRHLRRQEDPRLDPKAAGVRPAQEVPLPPRDPWRPARGLRLDVHTHEFQWMAAKGYVVLYTNPRGSTSYGQEFANIIQYRYPGDDYRDLMAGVDDVLRRGYVDEKKMGVTGGSKSAVYQKPVQSATERCDRDRAARRCSGRSKP